jgi:HSP20 family protein
MTDQTPKFDPVKEFTNIRDNLTKAVEQGIRNVAGGSFPLLDIYETADAVVIRTEPMIGAAADSIEISMENDVLTLSGETKNDLAVADGAYLLRELRFGKFTRSVRIPRKVRAEQAAAKFRNGVLTVTLPKLPDNSQIINITPAE